MIGPSRSRGRILFFLAVLHLLCHALLSLFIPLYVCMQRDFGLDRVEPVTALSTWVAVTFALATLVVGVLVDRMPGKGIAGVGLALHGIGLIALSQAPNLAWARLWLVVAAIGAAGYHPVAARWIVALYPEAVGRAMGLVGIGAGLGFFLGPWFSGWSTELAGWRAPLWDPAAWRAPMWQSGCVALVVAALYAWLVHEPELPAPSASEPLVVTRRDKLLLVTLLGVLGLALVPRDYAVIGVDTLSSLFLQRGYGLSVGLAGSWLAVKGLISLFTSPLLATLSDRGSRLAWWAMTLVLAGLAAIAIPWLPPAAAKVALVCHGVFVLANFPVFESALVERVPARLRGRAYALILTIVGLASAGAPKLVGRGVDRLVGSSTATVPPDLFRPLFFGLGVMLLASVLAVPLLGALNRRKP